MTFDQALKSRSAVGWSDGVPVFLLVGGNAYSVAAAVEVLPSSLRDLPGLVWLDPSDPVVSPCSDAACQAARSDEYLDNGTVQAALCPACRWWSPTQKGGA